MARLGPLDSAAAEVAFFLALSLVPFVAIAVALVGLSLAKIPSGESERRGTGLSYIELRHS